MRGPGKCGIYCITNRVSGESYVGKAHNIHLRYGSHLALLRAGRHHSKFLQSSFDRDGESAFGVATLEACRPNELGDKEYDWMLRVRPTLNHCVPDYLSVAKYGPDPRKRIHSRRATATPFDHGRLTCPCGQLKCLSSRFCVRCAETKVREMVAAGYLTPERSPCPSLDRRPQSIRFDPMPDEVADLIPFKTH